MSPGTLLLYLLCAPWDCAVLVVSAPLWLLGVRGVRRTRGVLWLDVAERSLLARRWRYSTTLGHVVLLQPGLAGGPVEAHELVHVRQYEGAVCGAWLTSAVGALGFALGGAVFAALLVVLGAPWWSYAGASLAAALRGQRAYLDNHFERHARAEVQVSSRAPAPQRGDNVDDRPPELG